VHTIEYKRESWPRGKFSQFVKVETSLEHVHVFFKLVNNGNCGGISEYVGSSNWSIQVNLGDAVERLE
jgi:hypothetical protein